MGAGQRAEMAGHFLPLESWPHCGASCQKPHSGSLSDSGRAGIGVAIGSPGDSRARSRSQAIFFRWNPGRIAVHLAKSHTPEVCLTAAGRELVSQSGLRAIPVHGLQLPFLSYAVRGEHGPLHVFYCLWEDRAYTQSFGTTMMTYANRLAPDRKSTRLNSSHLGI